MRKVIYKNVRVNNVPVADSIIVKCKDNNYVDVLWDSLSKMTYESKEIVYTKTYEPALELFKYVAVMRNVHSYTTYAMKLEICGRTTERFINKIASLLDTYSTL